jgi:hypothetical protein
VVRVAPLLVVRDEGMARGGFTVYPNRETVEFDGASTINPAALFRMIGVLTNEIQRSFVFGGPVTIAGKGVVDFGRMRQTDFRTTVTCRNLGCWTLDTEEATFNVGMKGLTNFIENVQGTMYGGRISGSATLIVPYGSETNLRYRVDAVASGVDFRRLVAGRIREPKEEYTGQLSGSVRVEGIAGTGCAKTAVGEGAVNIKNGRLFVLPLFGGLSQQIARVIPGVDFVVRQTDGSASFRIRDGKLVSDKALIEGGLLSLSGKGFYALDETLGFDVQIRLLRERSFVAKLLRVPTYVISKIFEFRLRGTLTKPDWYPVNFSWGLGDRLGLGTSRGEKAVRELEAVRMGTKGVPQAATNAPASAGAGKRR